MSVARPSTRRVFSFEQARALVPAIHRLTETAQERLALLDTAQGEPSDEAEDTVEEWAHAVSALGAEVKGLWLVDFDNGSGYYCWQFPETDLGFYHTYEDGFEARMRIQ
jgi:hypothetical protein